MTTHLTTFTTTLITITYTYICIRFGRKLFGVGVACVVLGFGLCGGVLSAEAFISGTVYVNAGITAAGSGITLGIAIGTTTTSVYTVTTSAGGVWSLSGVATTSITATTPITVWIDASTTDATTLVSGFNGPNITSIPIYYNNVLSYGAVSTSTVDITRFSFYSRTNDADILYTNNGNVVTVHDDFINKQGTFMASPQTTKFAGSYQNDAVFEDNNGSVEFTGTSETLSGTLTGTSALGAVRVRGSYTTSVALASTTGLVIESGASFTAPATRTSIDGGFFNQGTFSHNSGEMMMGGLKAAAINFLAGRDSGSSAIGTSSLMVRTMVVSGTTLYVGRAYSVATCTQATVDVSGCELVVLDISSSTNPIFMKALDSSGSTTGSFGADIISLAVSGSYLYVGKGVDSTACSQVAGSAIGCELMVFNISSSTNPVYVAGRDGDGSAAGTLGSSINSLAISGTNLYVGKSSDSTACSQTAGSADGCEVMVFGISSSTNPVYLAGRDGNGSATSTGSSWVQKIVVSGNSLYAAKLGSGTTCTQVIGGGIGCELMVFDISSSTNPVYIAGRDSSGSASGSGLTDMLGLDFFGNNLYAAKSGNATACSQVAGSAIGCELMVFDISSSTNPVYIAGRDGDGSAAGIASGSGATTVGIFGTSLYLTKGGDSTACSQVVGSAKGCEIMVFDISSSTNPLYVAGRDSDGSLSGITGLSMYSPMVLGNIMYLGKNGSSTACSQVVGAANGCELMIFDKKAPSYISGNLVGSSALGNLSIDGQFVISAIASTSNLTNYSLSTTTASSSLSVSGDLVNNGVLQFPSGGLLSLTGSSQTLSGSFVDTSQLPDVNFGGSGTKAITGNASTSDVVIASGVTVVAPAVLGIAGDFTNQGTFSNNSGEVYITGLQGEIKRYLAGRDSSGSVGGTTGTQINTMVTYGNYLYIGKNVDSTACSQTAGSAQGCEIQVYDISSSTNPVYVAGRDSDGAANGTTGPVVYSLAISGTYLYAGKGLDATACSQTAGSARGCELIVFNISSSTNPVYVAGRDTNGSATGATGLNIYAITIAGTTAYTGKLGSATACSQTAGSAEGCEIMAFDISSSSNPTYVGGRDSDGSSGGVDQSWVYAVTASGTNLYVGKLQNGTGCSQTAGSAQGCELQVYNIASSSNPIYVAGRDSDGTAGGFFGPTIWALMAMGNQLYVGKGNDGTACSPSDARGCELTVFDISSSTNPVYVAGRNSDGSATGTTGSTPVYSLTASASTVYLGKLFDGSACTSTAGSAQGCEIMAFDVSSSTNPTLISGFDSDGSATGTNGVNVQSLVTQGSSLFVGKLQDSGTCSQVAGSGRACELMVFRIGSEFSGNLSGTSAFNHVQVGGVVAFLNNASTSNLVLSGTLTAPQRLSVAGNYTNNGTFIAGGGTTTFSGAAQQTATGTLNGTSAFNNLEITNTSANGGSMQSAVFGAPVETNGTFTMRASTSAQFPANSTSTFAAVNWNGGSSTTRVYLRSSVTNTRWSFVTENSYESIGYINVSDSNNASTTPVLCTTGCVDVGNNSNWTFPNVGSLLLGESTSTQASNTFTFNNKTDTPLYAFKLTPSGESAVIDQLTIALAGVRGIDDTKITNIKLYRDNNSNGALDGADVQVMGTGILAVSDQTGTITFSSSTVATTTGDYLATVNTTALKPSDYMTVRLFANGISASGQTSLSPLTITGSVSEIQHIRGSFTGGAGYSLGSIGGDAPPGAGQQGGGEDDGGEEVGQEADGANIAFDPNFRAPTTNGTPHSEWTGGGNGYASDGVYATAASAGFRQTYGGFGFSIPGGNIVQGITVKVDGSGTTAAGSLQIGLSWDGGITITTVAATPTLVGTDVVYEVGGVGDLWGRVWTGTELNDTNFRVRIIAQPNSNTVRLDALEVRVYHTAGGGGGGGGGEI